MASVELKIIPHWEQRYQTCGDWTYRADGVLEIRVSDTGHAVFNWALCLHELVEAWLCRQAGITVEQVDAWDLKWSGEGEPGDHLDCPYLLQHQLAEVIERTFLWACGESWTDYQEALEKVEEEKP